MQKNFFWSGGVKTSPKTPPPPQKIFFYFFSKVHLKGKAGSCNEVPMGLHCIAEQLSNKDLHLLISAACAMGSLKLLQRQLDTSSCFAVHQQSQSNSVNSPDTPGPAAKGPEQLSNSKGNNDE